MISKNSICALQCRRAFTTSTAKNPSKISVYKSTSTNPFVNLAIESWLFSEPKNNDEYVLYLWRNAPSVIIGKFQSAWRECEIKKIEHNGVHLVRRPSGGGAVYQDLGNSIFTFISPKKQNANQKNIDLNNSILINALNTKYNIKAIATGRNDLCIDDLKISGAAFRNSKDRRLHHGTMLLNVDMKALGNYLTPNKVKLQSKGVSSVQARVLNLQTIVPTITHEDIGDAILDSFLKEHQIEGFDSNEIISIDEDSELVRNNEHIQNVMKKLQDWDWRFGTKDPGFTHKIETTRLSWGTFDINMIVKSNMIVNTTIYTDALDVPLITSIQQLLSDDIEYTRDSLSKTIDHFILTIDPEQIDTIANILELKDLLVTSV